MTVTGNYALVDTAVLTLPKAITYFACSINRHFKVSLKREMCIIVYEYQSEGYLRKEKTKIGSVGVPQLIFKICLFSNCLFLNILANYVSCVF
jgi:hypothetical protein